MNMIKIATSEGLKEVPALHLWSQNIMGHDFQFALHATANGAKGFERRLAISELSTGFDIRAKILHPKSRMELTVNSSAGIKRSELKKLAHAAAYNLVRTIGGNEFVKAFLDARLSLALRGAKIQEFNTAGIKPEASGPSDTFSPPEVKMNFQASTKDMGILERIAAACAACNGSQVVATTEKDHEGNAIETTCPACISKAIELAETPVSEMLASLKARLDALNDVAAQHGTMTGDTTEQDYEDLAYNICDLEMQIAELEKTQ